MLRLILVTVSLSLSLALSADEVKSNTKQSERKVGDEIHRDYERRQEHIVTLTEEEVERRKQDADRASQMISAKVAEIYDYTFPGQPTFGMMVERVQAFARRHSVFMDAHLLRATNNVQEMTRLKALLDPILTTLSQGDLFVQPASLRPDLVASLKTIAEAYRDLAFQTAMQKWENDKALYH